MDLTIDLDKDDEPKKRKRTRPTILSLHRMLCNVNGRRCDDDDDDVIDICRDSDMYLAARTGNLNNFERCLHRVLVEEHASHNDILSNSSPARNTYLHIAANYGNTHIVNFIAEKKPSLLLSKNLDGETALHLAAKAGQETTVRALVKIHQDLLPENGINNLLRAETERGNTALHEALSDGRNLVAQYLINEDPELPYHRNKNGESGLYLAAKAGLADCVALILEFSTDERVNELFRKKSPIQAAIQGKHRGVLEAMFKKNPSLIQSRDGEGRNPLHYAASLGYVEEVRYLLKQYTRNATQRDNKGSFPIHLASIEGHVDVVSLLLRGCLYPWELLDRDRRNILHLAAKHGRFNIVNFVLENPNTEVLINMKDKHGNVPLHLATMNWHPKIVSTLTWDKRVNNKLVNDKGMTALGVAEYYMSYNPPFMQRLTWAALKAAGTPGSLLASKALARKKKLIMDDCKQRVNTLLVVSILVATVTFAAGFTVPGGYNSSESSADSGMATMFREKGFHVFVVCDTIAMYSSIVVAVALFYAQLGDLTLMIDALSLALPLLGIALSMMSMAFAAGIFVAVSKIRWLATAVLVMGVAFVVILFLILLPLCVSYTSRNWVLRYLSYYPFRLMIWATGSS